MKKILIFTATYNEAENILNFLNKVFSLPEQLDILIIDEALSVGDLTFQKKCVQRMNEFKEQNKTLVFCSHSIFHVQELCERAIWLHEGRIRDFGDSDRVVGRYEDFCNSRKVYHTISEDTASDSETDREVKTPDCKINALNVLSDDGKKASSLEPLGNYTLEMEIEVLKENIEGNFGFAFMKSSEEPVASFLTTDIKEVEKGPFNKGDKFTVSLSLSGLPMRVGEFYILGGLADKSGLLWYERKFSKLFHVEANKGVGPLVMNSKWTVRKS